LEASTEEISKVVKSEKIAKRIKESLGEKWFGRTNQICQRLLK
jgi:hypothetical protein